MVRIAPRAARVASAAVLAAGIALAASRPAPAAGGARAILLVPDSSASTSDGRFPDLDDEEIVVFDPARPGSLVPFLQDVNWPTLLGDANRDGRLDDAPARVDAIAPAGDTAASAFDLLFSFSSDRVFLGQLVRDGDLVRLVPGGSFEVVISEAALRAALATEADIDLDAAAFAPDGAFLFSLDDTIGTSSSLLARENGGSRLLSDATVFEIPAGAATARVLFREADVLRMVNRALGTAYLSVVDLQGLEIVDGEILFTTGILTGPATGTVFTARAGGEVAALGGVPLDGGAFGTSGREDWNGLAAVATPLSPLVLDTATPSVSRSGDARIEVRIASGTPFGRARLLATPLARPMSPPSVEGTLGGTGYVFLERSSPMYARSLVSPRTLVPLDARGDATISFPLRATTPVMALGLQAIDETTRTASHAIVIEIR